MNRSAIHRRLAALVGDEQALELLEAPNFNLSGKTPEDLIDQGDTATVLAMVHAMEAQAGGRRVSRPSPHDPPADIDHNAGDPLLDHIPECKHTQGAGRLFRILDQLERGGSR